MNNPIHFLSRPESTKPGKLTTAFFFRRLGGSAPRHLPPCAHRLPGFLALGSAAVLALTAAKAVAANVVVNGDFSAGYAGISTDYLLDEKLYWVSSTGYYAIGTNPRDHNSNYVSMGDHTTGDGKMMVVNGATAVNRTVWFQDDIPVIPNTDYNIFFWAASAHADSPATLKIHVNHLAYGDPVTLSTTAGKWEKFSFNWKSPKFGSRMSLTIYDTNLTAGGNDFVLDDITVIPEPSIPLTIVLGCGLAFGRRR